MSQSLTDSPSVDHFRSTAARFCTAIDQRGRHTAPGLLRQLQPILAALCSSALSLPDLEEVNPFEPSEDHAALWRPLHSSLSVQLGPYSQYWEIFDPFLLEEPLSGSLADDFADIYLDLYPGITAWDEAGAQLRRDIVWDWRYGYASHWGRHATDALRAVHTLLFVHRIDEPGREWPPPHYPSDAAGAPGNA